MTLFKMSDSNRSTISSLCSKFGVLFSRNSNFKVGYLLRYNTYTQGAINGKILQIRPDTVGFLCSIKEIKSKSEKFVSILTKRYLYPKRISKNLPQLQFFCRFLEHCTIYKNSLKKLGRLKLYLFFWMEKY